MRKILLFPALFFISLVVSATEGSQGNVTSTPQVGGMFPHFANNAGGSAVSADLRLIAKTYSVFKDAWFIPVDSTTYSYGGNRGSVPNPDDLNNDDHILFDESVNRKFNPSVMGYENDQQRLQSFKGKKVEQLTYKKWHQKDAIFKNVERYTYTYDANGKMEQSLLQLWYAGLWTQNMVSSLNYDNSNNVIAMKSFNYTVDFIYDANNNLIVIQDKKWDASKGLVNNERKSYSYSGKDVIEYVLEKWDNGWVLSQKWSYDYDVNDNVRLTTEYRWSGGWDKISQHKYDYDNNGNVTVDILKLWDAGSNSFVESKMESITYNSKSLPETLLTQTWTSNGWKHLSGDISIRYYYESYDPTAVNAILANADINVFPIPASDKLNVAVNWDEPQDFALSLTDMSGRVVFYQQERAQRNYNESVSVTNLPSGNYILAVSGKQAGIHRRITISH